MKIVSSNCQLEPSDSVVKVYGTFLVRLPRMGTVTVRQMIAGTVTICPYWGDNMVEGVRQVETATCAGTVTVAGDAAVVVTGAYITDSPITLSAPVAEGADASAIACAVRNTLNNDSRVTEQYTIGGSAALVTLTAKDYRANDSTLNLNIADGTSTGVTTAATSANTIAGVAITLLTTNEYKTLTKTDMGWTVIDAGGENRSETLLNKTLTTPIIASMYQDAGKTKLMSLPNVASDTLVSLAAAQTLTNKTISSPSLGTPVITNPATTYTLSPHDYAGAAADWTLSAAELLLPVHKPTNANGPVNAIVAVTIRPYTFINTTGQNLVVKTAAGTGITIASTKTAMVMSDGTNVIRLTPDA